MDNNDKYVEDLKEYKVVSFDVFDTLITRTVSCPEDIFDLIPIKLPQIPGIINFRKKRIKAEQIARSFAKGKEVDIDEIYKNIDYPLEFREKLKACEGECEIKNCVPIKDNVLLAQRLYDNGAMVIITTDMYLNRETISSILQKVGVKYHKLFISGEVKKTKESGLLFDYILKELTIKPNEIAHIGDNPISDIKMAESRGIKAFEGFKGLYIKENDYYPAKGKDIVSCHLNNFFRKSLNEPLAPAVRIGYNVLGVFIYDFCQWLHEIKEERQLDRLIFVAREGYLIYKSYIELYPGEKNRVTYASLNRNVMRCSYLKTQKDKVRAFIKTIPELKEKTLDYVLSYLGTTSKDLSVANTIVTHDELMRGTHDEIIEKALRVKSQYIDEQDKLFREYLHQIGINNNKIGLVNNSLNGTGQMLLEEILKETATEITGLQFVKTKKCERRLGNRFCTYIQDNKINHDFQLWCYVLEHLMFENAGTSLGLVREQSVIIPRHEIQRNEQNNKGIIDDIQKNTLRFIQEYKNNSNLPIRNYAINIMRDMLSYPLKVDALLIGRIYNDDEQGDSKIVEEKTPFRSEYVLSRNIPKSVLWVEGYFTILDKGRLAISIYRAKQRLSLLFHQPKS